MRQILIALLAIEGIGLGFFGFFTGFFALLTGFNWQWVLLTLVVFAMMAGCGYVQRQLIAANPGPWIGYGCALILGGCILALWFRTMK